MRGSVLVTNTQMFVLVSRGVLYAVPVCATCRYTRIQQATSGHGRFNLRKRSSCQLKKRPGGPQGKSGRFGVTETSFPCPEVSMEYAGRVNTSLHTSARTVADCSAKCTCYQWHWLTAVQRVRSPRFLFVQYNPLLEPTLQPSGLIYAKHTCKILHKVASPLQRSTVPNSLFLLAQSNGLRHFRRTVCIYGLDLSPSKRPAWLWVPLSGHWWSGWIVVLIAYRG